jgi:hypothetical protein
MQIVIQKCYLHQRDKICSYENIIIILMTIHKRDCEI